MSRPTKLILISFGVVVALLLVAGIALRLLVSGRATQALVSALNDRLPVAVAIGSGKFDAASLLRLRPAIALEKLSISNPQGFSAEPMIQADELSAQVSLTSLFSDTIRVNRIALIRPVVRVESNQAGQVNVASLGGTGAKPQPPGEAAPETPSQGVAIDSLNIEKASLAYFEAGAQTSFLRVDDLDIQLSDFSPDSSFRLTAGGRLFGGSRSKVAFNGHAGPFQPASLPAEGDLELILGPADLPADLLKQHFGNLLADPGDDSLLDAKAHVSGDLMKTIGGKGELRFANFLLGRDDQHRMALEGTVPLDLTVAQPLKAPVIGLTAPASEIRFGAGTLNASLGLKVGSDGTSGNLQGAMEGIDINELLSAFSDSAGQVYGQAAITGIDMRFAGSSGDELLNSLTGTAHVGLSNGRITMLDTINTVVGTAGAALQIAGLTGSSSTSQQSSASGETEFTTLTSDVAVANRRVNLTNLSFGSPMGDVAGGGAFTFEQALNFQLVAKLKGDAAKALGTDVPFSVTGTFAKPVVRPDTKKLAVGTASRILGGFLGGKK